MENRQQATLNGGQRDIFAECIQFHRAPACAGDGGVPYFRPSKPPPAIRLLGGRRKIMIGSNNYLGLAQDERVIEAAQNAIRKYGSGCTGSRFLNGNIRLHEQLEEDVG